VLGIAFALGASACWGTADFLGGLFSRRLSVLVVLFTIEVSGLLVVAAVVAGTVEPLPAGREALAALVAGTAGISALGAFYRALAIGTMSIVAPISACGVALPVVVGLATGDALSTVVATGLVVTVAGVILASRHVEDGDGVHAAPSRASIGLALLAALGFGTFFITYDVAADGSLLWAMLLSRVVAVPFVGGLILLRRPALPSRDDLAKLAAVGIVDLSAIALYALANRHGDLSVVSVVGSLYPVMTVLLARVVLSERIARSQAVGVAAALVGVALVAAG
jgi:drug/metabolite transporter (DMT)-like permease